MDLSVGNFMQDAKGNVIALDPVISRDLLDAIIKSKSQRWREEHPFHTVRSQVIPTILTNSLEAHATLILNLHQVNARNNLGNNGYTDEADEPIPADLQAAKSGRYLRGKEDDETKPYGPAPYDAPPLGPGKEILQEEEFNTWRRQTPYGNKDVDSNRLLAEAEQAAKLIAIEREDA
jgi:hypothetical protein